MRCPSCGNEVRKEDFTCIYCNAILREESIEKIKVFKRIEEKWTDPIGGRFKRLLSVFINPSKTFWDITHYRSKIGGSLVYLLIAVSFALEMMAVVYHLTPAQINIFNMYLFSLTYLAFFLQFFLFGLIYFGLFLFFARTLYSLGANYSINFSKQIEARYGERNEEKEEDDQKTSTQKEAEGSYVSELPEYLIEEKSKKTDIMNMAFAPLIVAYGISALIILIALPSDITLIPNSYVWGIVDWIQVIILIGWVSITMAIALRDFANASTLRVYLSCLVVSIILGLIFYFFRPSFLFFQM